MKKITTLLLICALCATMSVPALAYNYEFQSGPDAATTFGTPSSTDEPVAPDPMSENTRRNKDAALLPPPYFYGSGDIPTDPSSLYHEQRDAAPNGPRGGDGGWPSSIGPLIPPTSDFDSSTSIVPISIAPKYYADGSIGKLYVPRTGKTIKVYEGESLDNLKKGAGHFSSTSAWDGNVGLCGHNRGNPAYFGFVKDLKIGDKVTYTTLYGTRTYEVYDKEQISEYDYSKLSWSAENLLTLITCVSGTPELRWAAVCREVR